MSDFWTAEKTAEAKRLYLSEGKSAAQTAREIGAASRNAVLAKAQRMGWKRGPEVGQLNSLIANRGSAKKPPVLKVVGGAPIDDGVSKPGRPIALAGPVSASLNVTIAHSAFRSLGCCKWPTSDETITGAAITFCCVATDSVYCTKHPRAAYTNTPAPTRRQDQRDLPRLVKRFA